MGSKYPEKFLTQELERLVAEQIKQNGVAALQIYAPHTITVARKYGVKIEDKEINRDGHMHRPRLVELR